MDLRLERLTVPELPEDQRISRLLREIERTRRSYMDQELKAAGLQGDMYLYLLQVSSSPGISQDQLARVLLVEKGNIARNARKLEDLGYLVRRASASDKRQNELFLTEKGEETVQQIRKILIHWHETVTASMDQAARKRLAADLLDILMKAETLR